MAEHFFIRMTEPGDQATALALDAEGRLIARPEVMTLATAAARAGDRQVTVMLPAREFVTLTAALPSVSPTRLRRMLPFSLEDEFATDIDDLHFAAGARNDEDRLAVSVIASSRLDAWIDQLRTAGIDARHVVSEADGVPDTPGITTLFLEGRQILGRRPGRAPFAFDELSLSELWHVLAGETGDRDDLDDVVLFADPDTLAARRAEIEAWQPAVANLNVRELADGCLPRLAANLVHRPGPNLLQGAYATRSDYAMLVQPWRLAGGFALGLLALSLVGTGAEVFKLSGDDQRLTEQATELCTRYFSSPQLARCRLEVQRLLAANNQASASGGPGFLGALATLAESAGDTLTIENLNYRNATLTLDVIAPSAAYLDGLNQQLAATGEYQLIIESMDNVPNGAGMKTRMRVVEPQP